MKPLDRLRQQYLETKKEESKIINTLRVSNYTGMRYLCLDCELVSFKDIEDMEDEVNSSFKSFFAENKPKNKNYDNN